MYFLESPRQSDSNKYTKRTEEKKWEYQWKNTQSADFCADQIDVITNFAVIIKSCYKEGSL